MPRLTLTKTTSPVKFTQFLEFYGLRPGTQVRAEHTDKGLTLDWEVISNGTRLTPSFGSVDHRWSFKWIEHPYLPEASLDYTIPSSSWPTSLEHLTPTPSNYEARADASPITSAPLETPPMKTVARSVIAQKPAPTEKDPKATVEITLEGPTLLNIENNELAPSVQEWIMNNIPLINEKKAIPGTIQIMTSTFPTGHNQHT